MGRPKYDYDALEKEFIQTPLSMSVREFARNHDNMPWSALNAKVKAGGWIAKREDFHRKATDRAIAIGADRIAQKITAMREDALDVIHTAFLKMGADMADRTYTTLDAKGNPVEVTIPGQVVTPDHMAKLIDKFLLLTGNATAITEERSQSVASIDFSGLDPELVRAFADLGRERGAQRRTADRPRLPGATGSRTN